MDRSVKIPWIGESIYHGSNTMDRRVDIPWVGEVKIPWIGGQNS
jgi:hypothetical protein